MTHEAATLRLAVVPRSGLLLDGLLALGGAAFIGLLAQISYQPAFTPVPYTGQTFGVLLVGAAYGSRLGAASSSLYALLGIVGVPLYADHRHGWDVLMLESRKRPGGALYSEELTLPGFLHDVVHG